MAITDWTLSSSKQSGIKQTGEIVSVYSTGESSQSRGYWAIQGTKQENNTKMEKYIDSVYAIAKLLTKLRMSICFYIPCHLGIACRLIQELHAKPNF